MIVHETRHASGGALARHRHAEAYAAFVLEGEYEEMGPDGVWRISAGELVLHPPFHSHLNRFRRRHARVLNFVLPHKAARALGLWAYKVLRPADPAPLMRPLALDALADIVALASPRAPAPAADWLDVFAAQLREHPEIRIGVLARAHKVTPEHASRAFASRFGMAPAAYRGELRLRTALDALAQAARPLAEIAALSGFADQAHFSRAMVAATGLSPARLRRALH